MLWSSGNAPSRTLGTLDFGLRQTGCDCHFRHFQRSTAPALDDVAPIEGPGDQRIPGYGFVRGEQLLGNQSEVQHSHRSDLQPVVVDRDADGTATYRIVAVAERVASSPPYSGKTVTTRERAETGMLLHKLMDQSSACDESSVRSCIQTGLTES